MKRELVEGLVMMTMRERPLSTLGDVQHAIHDACAVTVSKSLVATVLRRNNMTRKKARFYGQPRDLETKTAKFLSDRQAAIDAGRPMYSVDETSFGRHVGTSFGYAPRGAKVFVRKQSAHVQTRTVVACVRADGAICRVAFPGSCNTERFLQFLKTCDVPSGATILLDNFGFHRSRCIASWANERGVQLLFVPPYSPWFNPIEGCFSIVKRAFYKGQTIDESFAALTPAHCGAFFSRSLAATTRF